jgi:PTS system beta-glucosides-specific IIC component
VFKFLKKEKEHWLGSPVKGKTVLLQEVNDPTFSEEMLGKGIGVLPSDNGVYAPADGEITMVFDTLHAVSMMTEYGAEILIHVGLDTVEMKGEGFAGHVKAGDRVKKGKLLLNVDMNKVRERGYDPITLMVICNTGDYALVEGTSQKDVLAGDDILFIEEK